ncbi:hypothetical protein GCM10027168_33800 [Streptomyces capparidis]
MTTPTTYTLRAPVNTLAPKICRDLVAGVLHMLGHERHAYTAKLLTSEFVTNSYLHAEDTDIVTLDIEVSKPALRVTVHDGAPEIPRQGAPSLDSPGGRGLHITSALATAWGSTVTVGQGGKGVWFEITL